MNISSIAKKIVFILLLVLVVSFALQFIFQSKDSIVFEVIIPAHTPDLDAIVLHVGSDQFVMTRKSDTLYSFELKFDDFPDQEGASIPYGYSRGGFGPFAEAGLFKNQYFRSFKIETGSTIKDIVSEWKWFPKEPLNEILIPTDSNIYPIAPRNEFWKGVMFVDFWNDEWELQYNASIAHLNEKGYDWIALAPPWDFVTVDPPVLSDTDVEVPSYPEDKLRNLIRVFKGAGFNVLLSPQVCCTLIDVSDRSEVWWNQWYDEQDKFHQFFVDLAVEEGVDALSIGPSFFGADLPLSSDLPIYINGTERWLSIIDLLKSAGIPVGFELATFSAIWPDQNAIPWPGTDINFYDQLDFLGISLWSELVDFVNPTQDDFNAALESVFEQVDRIYNQTDLPIVFTQVSYPSNTGAGLGPNPETALLYEDPAFAPFEYNPFEQAMIYESFMRSIANRSYIQGSFPFGYWYLDAPLTVDDPSIRGKMAEEIYSRWLSRFPNSLQSLEVFSYNEFVKKTDPALILDTQLNYPKIWCTFRSDE